MRKLLYTIFFILSSFFFISNAKAFTDDFDSYSTGNLNTQGGWVSGSDQNEVSNVQSLSNPQSLRGGVSSGISYHSIAGSLTQYYIEYAFYSVSGGAGGVIYQRVNQGSDDRIVSYVAGTNFNIYTGTTYAVGSFSLDTWNTARVEINLDTQEIRGQLNSGSWTAWYTFNAPTINTLVDIKFTENNAYTYIDDVAVGALTPGFVSIDSVPAFIPTGNYLFTGGCDVNGSNRLRLTNGYYFESPTEASDFNIDCISNLWSVISTINPSGPHEKRIFDLDWLQDPQTTATTTAYVAYTGVQDNYEYQLGISYPSAPDTGNLYEIQQSNDWIFRFAYGSTPSNTKFTLDKLCDSSYSNCTAAMNNSLSYYDADGNNYLDTIANAVIASSTIGYYVASLVDSASVVRFEMFFRTIGSTATNTQQAIPPGVGECSALCETFKFMFVPSKTIMNLYANTLPNLLQSKKPFSYFYEIKNKLTAVNVTSTTLVLGLDMDFGGATMTLNFFDSEEINFRTITDTARPYIIALLWGLMLFYIAEIIIHHPL